MSRKPSDKRAPDVAAYRRKVKELRREADNRAARLGSWPWNSKDWDPYQCLVRDMEQTLENPPAELRAKISDLAKRVGRLPGWGVIQAMSLPELGADLAARRDVLGDLHSLLEDAEQGPQSARRCTSEQALGSQAHQTGQAEGEPKQDQTTKRPPIEAWILADLGKCPPNGKVPMAWLRKNLTGVSDRTIHRRNEEATGRWVGWCPPEKGLYDLNKAFIVTAFREAVMAKLRKAMSLHLMRQPEGKRGTDTHTRLRQAGYTAGDINELEEFCKAEPRGKRARIIPESDMNRADQ